MQQFFHLERQPEHNRRKDHISQNIQPQARFLSGVVEPSVVRDMSSEQRRGAAQVDRETSEHERLGPGPLVKGQQVEAEREEAEEGIVAKRLHRDDRVPVCHGVGYGQGEKVTDKSADDAKEDTDKELVPGRGRYDVERPCHVLSQELISPDVNVSQNDVANEDKVQLSQQLPRPPRVRLVNERVVPRRRQDLREVAPHPVSHECEQYREEDVHDPYQDRVPRVRERGRDPDHAGPRRVSRKAERPHVVRDEIERLGPRAVGHRRAVLP